MTKAQEGEVLEKGKVGRPSKYKPEYCEILKETFKQGGHVSQFCTQVGIAECTFFNRWLRDHEDLEEAYKEAKTYSKAFYETLLLRGALGDIKNFNFQSVAMIMNNKFREEYIRSAAPSTEINIGTLNSLDSMDSSQLENKIEQLQKKLGYTDQVPETDE